MQFALTVLSAFALVGTSLADPFTVAFTTWNCNNCALNGGGSACRQIPHQNVPRDVCFRLEANQQSLVVNNAQGPCRLQLFGTTNCSDNGPTYPFERPDGPCKPIPVNANTAYKVICD